MRIAQTLTRTHARSHTYTHAHAHTLCTRLLLTVLGLITAKLTWAKCIHCRNQKERDHREDLDVGEMILKLI
jgi:hypothetical protein